jgi:uncharacterized protein YlxW (UPF0749 family)
MERSEGLTFAEAIMNVVGNLSAVVEAQGKTLQTVAETQLLLAQFVDHVQKNENATARSVNGLVDEIKKTQAMVAKKRAEHMERMRKFQEAMGKP